MTTTAQSVIRRAAETLQDLGAVRWSTGELVRYLNDGQRETVIYRPDATATNAVFSCAAGARQTLPATAYRLLDVTTNAAASSARGVVRIINRNLLDHQLPNWQNETQSINVKHLMLDPLDRTTFYVYPPATNLAQLNVVFSNHPTDITEPASGTYTTVTGNISLMDELANALCDYVLYRAFAKDAEQAGNAARAQAHYAMFANAVGIELKSATGAAPSPRGNPNRAA